jgi:hypothetical protein
MGPIVVVLFCLAWAGTLIDAYRRPQSAWIAADKDRSAWIMLLLIFGIIMWIPYVSSILPRLIRAGKARATTTPYASFHASARSPAAPSPATPDRSPGMAVPVSTTAACRSCGRTLTPEAFFCGACGTPRAQPVPPGCDGLDAVFGIVSYTAGIRQ